MKTTFKRSYQGNFISSKNDIQQLHNQAQENIDSYWKQQALELDWIKPFTKIKNVQWSKEKVSIRWFEDGIINACYNCLDRHLPHSADKTAFYFEGNEKGKKEAWSFQKLYDSVCQMSHVLNKNGVKKGDVVTIYMPLIPEALVAMLACARIGAIHSVVFAGFSPHSLANRIDDCQSPFIVTADFGYRGIKKIPLKSSVDEAIEISQTIIQKKFVLFRESANNIQPNEINLQSAMTKEEPHYSPKAMNAESPLFILYTSGSTGQPKGVLHTTGGYLTYALSSFNFLFPVSEKAVYWCTADIGWITGHTYVLYAPLLKGVTSLIYEGVPQYPQWNRWWNIIDDYQVEAFYTAPTAIRSLKLHDKSLKNFKGKSLKVLGSVGEPIDENSWEWYYKSIGQSSCAIVDTWWQTETGGVLISPQPPYKLKPGSAVHPLPGIEPVLINEEGQEIEGEGQGFLCLKQPWPGQMRTVYKHHDRFIKNYFSQFEGYYFTGDGAKRDKDGYLWVTGRIDDIIIVSGHNLSTAEFETTLSSQIGILEVAVIGVPHPIKGNGICAFVVIDSRQDTHLSDNWKTHLNQIIKKEIGPIAHIDHLILVKELPKTRSGKVMRRLLRSAWKKESNYDITTLANPHLMEGLSESIEQQRNT